jgi:hypothetical protein
MTPRLEASGDLLSLSEMRSWQARIFTLRAQAGQVGEVLDWLEPTARRIEDPQLHILSLGSAALARAGLGQDAAAIALLTELEAYPAVRENAYYAVSLAAMVRTALGMSGVGLAEHLVSGFEPRYPYAEHALGAATAALAEAAGTYRPRPMATVTPRSAGRGSGSSPSRPGRSWAGAGVSSALRERPRPARSCEGPARSSPGFKRPPPWPRPTPSCTRRSPSVPEN